MLSTIDRRSAARWWAIRIAALPVIFVVVSFASYFLLFGPQHDDPAEIIGGRGLTIEQREEIRRALHLDEPLVQRYGRWLADVARRDLGDGYFAGGRSIGDELRRRLPPTVQLVAASFLVALAAGAALAYGVTRGDAVGRIAIIVASFVGSIPYFATLTLLIIIPSYLWSYAQPVGGYVSFFEPLTNLRLMGPGSALVGLATAPIVSRVLIERAAFGRGMFMLASAALVALASWAPAGIGAAIVTERILSIRGVGEWLFIASLQRDLMVIQSLLSGITFVGVAMRLFAMPVAPLPQARRDPTSSPRWVTDPLILAGFALLTILVLLAIVGPVLSAHEPNATNINAKHEGPSLSHWFGTDKFGKDMLTRNLHGLRNTLLLTSGVTAVATAFALSVWYAASATPARLRQWLLFALTLACGASAIAWLLAIYSTFGRDEQSELFALAMGYCGVATWQVLRLPGKPPRSRADVRSFAPNAMRLLASTFAGLILLITTLEYLGLDYRELGEPTLGSDLSRGLQEGTEYPHLVIFPILIIGLLLFSLSLISETLYSTERREP